MMSLLYVAQFLLVAFALVALAQKLSARIGVPPGPWAAFNVALTPHILATITLALAGVWPGAPRVAFLLVPATIGVVVLVALRSNLFELCVALCSSARCTKLTPLVLAFAAACVLLVFLDSLIKTVASPITGFDALVYAAEARTFAEHRTLAAIPGFDAGIGEIVKAHPHQFLWQAYISQALMATDGSIGFPNDVVARYAIVLTVPLLVVAVTALAYNVIAGWYALLAVSVIFLIDQIRYIPAAGSVDAFRIIPFVGLVCLVLALVGRRRRITPAFFINVVVLATFAALSHTINVVFLAILFGTLILVAPFVQITWQNVALVQFAAVVSMVPSLVIFAHNFSRYGSPFGLGFDYYFYRNSPLWEVFASQRAWTAAQNPLRALIAFIKLQGASISIAAILAAVFQISFRSRRDPKLTLIAMIFLMLLCVPLISLGGDVTLQGAMLSNPRYGLLTYSVVPCLVAGIIAALLCNLPSGPSRSVRVFHFLISLGVAGAMSVFSSRVVLNWGLETPSSAKAYLDESELLVASLADQLSKGANWAVDRYSVAYYSNRPPIKLTSLVGQHLIQAKSREEVEQQLDTMNIRMVAFYAEDWWRVTPLYQTVTTHRGVQVIKNKRWHIFILRYGERSWNNGKRD